MDKYKDITIFYKKTDLDTENIFWKMDSDIHHLFFEFLVHTTKYFIYIKTDSCLNVVNSIELKNEDFKKILGIDILNDEHRILEPNNGFGFYNKEIYSDRGLMFLRQIKFIERKIKLNDIL